MAPLRSSIAIKSCALLALWLIGSAAGAEPIGKVSDASGLLLARTASGSIKVLAVGSGVEQGETLFTRTNTYAQIRLSDQSTVALGPDTELSVETYSFHQTSPDPTDSAALKLSRGRVRISSGILGTRQPDRFTLTAGVTTVDIGRSAFIATYISPASSDLAWHGFDLFESRAPAISDSGVPTTANLRVLALASDHKTGLYKNVSLHLAQNIPGGAGAAGGSLNPGLYVQVLDGMINVKNGGGTQNFTAGQFGFTPGFQQPPVILPSNPGLQFTPPPSFSSPSTQNNTGGSKPGDVDCIVR